MRWRFRTSRSGAAWCLSSTRETNRIRESDLIVHQGERIVRRLYFAGIVTGRPSLQFTDTRSFWCAYTAKTVF